MLVFSPAHAQDADTAAVTAGSGSVPMPPSTSSVLLKISEMEEQQKDLTGKVETLENQQAQILDRLSKVEGEILKMSRQMAATPAQPVSVVPAGAVAATSSEPAKQMDPTKPVSLQQANSGVLGSVTESTVSANDQSVMAPVVTAPLPNTPEAAYEFGFELVKKQQYREGITELDNFIQKYSKNKLVPNAYYWKGEAHYALDEKRQAAVQFLKSYEADRKGSKAPDSLLKLALALSEIDKKDDACITLKQLEEEFKKPPAAIKSRMTQEQRRLSCPK